MLLRAILIGIVLLLIARAFWRVVDGLIEGVGGRPRKTVRGAKRLLRDPVCGTYVVPNPLLSLTTSGGTVYFCSESCRQKFGARK